MDPASNPPRKSSSRKASANCRSAIEVRSRLNSTGEGLVLGTMTDGSARSFGFSGRIERPESGDGQILRHIEPTHGIVFVRTGGGKFLSVVAPNVFSHRGQLIILDPKGECAQVTARYRRSCGEVAIIDPFGILGPKTDSLNPLDALFLPGMNVEDGSESLACELSAGHESAKDPFWHYSSTTLLSALIASAAQDPQVSKRHLGTVVDALSADDVVYQLAVALDNKQIQGDFAQRRIAEFLQVPDGTSAATRGCILVSAQQYIHCLQASRIRRCIEHSSFSLLQLLEGENPITVYFVFPVSKIRSHRGLLRLFLSTIMTVLSSRRAMPREETLVIIDEAANLGRMDQLPMMHSFLRGAGVSLLTLWQSLGQISDLYPTEWRTIIENCGVIQTFSLHPTAVDPIAALLGVSPDVLRSLSSIEQLVVRPDKPTEILGRVDYRTHPAYRKLADPNPRYINRTDNRATSRTAPR